MSDITITPETILKRVERLRERYWRSATESDVAAKERRQREREEGADIITALRAENERLRAALELFACDCTAKHLCAQPDYCVNYIARAALEEK